MTTVNQFEAPPLFLLFKLSQKLKAYEDEDNAKEKLQMRCECEFGICKLFLQACQWHPRADIEKRDELFFWMLQLSAPGPVWQVSGAEEYEQ